MKNVVTIPCEVYQQHASLVLHIAAVLSSDLVVVLWSVGQCCLWGNHQLVEVVIENSR